MMMSGEVPLSSEEIRGVRKRIAQDESTERLRNRTSGTVVLDRRTVMYVVRKIPVLNILGIQMFDVAGQRFLRVGKPLRRAGR